MKIKLPLWQKFCFCWPQYKNIIHDTFHKIVPSSTPFPMLNIQYRSKVSWQSLDPQDSSLKPRDSNFDSFEYRVSSLPSIELQVEKVNELVAWLISREINWTNGLPVLRAIVPLSLAITKMRATNSIVNTDKGTRVFSCDVYSKEWMNLPPK